jgi:hypothetical protein
MTNAAEFAAAMSDPDQNRQFSRPWRGPRRNEKPPRQRQPARGVSENNHHRVGK